jgi:hypothetical protein
LDGFHTVGQAAAVAAVHAMLRGRVPHAVLLAGPPSVGKHALALDIAAALLCTGAAGADRPCRACRGCRMVEHGNHPDLHSLAPSGAGNQIRIGDDQHPEPGTIRGLAVDLALLPVEGGERVAVIRDAQRMNEVAQSALLKTLEEPPPATTVVLCVDDEEQLLPTIRSRCARIRLGTVATRDIERLLGDRDLADPGAPCPARRRTSRPRDRLRAVPGGGTRSGRAGAHAARPPRPAPGRAALGGPRPADAIDGARGFARARGRLRPARAPRPGARSRDTRRVVARHRSSGRRGAR